MESGAPFVITPGMTLMPEWCVLKWDTLPEVQTVLHVNLLDLLFILSHMQVRFLVARPTSMEDLDQFNLPASNAMEQKLDYRTVPTQYKILALILLMLVLHALVSLKLI